MPLEKREKYFLILLEEISDLVLSGVVRFPEEVQKSGHLENCHYEGTHDHRAAQCAPQLSKVQRLRARHPLRLHLTARLCSVGQIPERIDCVSGKKTADSPDECTSQSAQQRMPFGVVLTGFCSRDGSRRDPDCLSQIIVCHACLSVLLFSKFWPVAVHWLSCGGRLAKLTCRGRLQKPDAARNQSCGPGQVRHLVRQLLDRCLVDDPLHLAAKEPNKSVWITVFVLIDKLL